MQLALTGDGRVVTGGEDGRVYLMRLGVEEPMSLAQLSGEVAQFVLTGVWVFAGDGRVYCAPGGRGSGAARAAPTVHARAARYTSHFGLRNSLSHSSCGIPSLPQPCCPPRADPDLP
jgi:hypothetical protein